MMKLLAVVCVCILTVYGKQDDLQRLRSKVVELEKSSTRLQEDIVQQYQQNNRNLDTPAFMAQLSSNRSVADGLQVIYDNEVYDATNAYDNINGFFRAPHQGVYKFTVTIQSPEAKKSQVVLRVISAGSETRYMTVTTYMYDSLDVSGVFEHLCRVFKTVCVDGVIYLCLICILLVFNILGFVGKYT